MNSARVSLIITTANQAMVSMALGVPTAWVGGYNALSNLAAMGSGVVAGELVPRLGSNGSSTTW